MGSWFPTCDHIGPAVGHRAIVARSGLGVLIQLIAKLWVLGEEAVASLLGLGHHVPPRGRRLILPFSELATRLALPEPAPGATEISGNVAGFHVHVDGTPEAVFISLDGRGHIPPWFRLEPMARMVSDDDERLTTHDRFFDELFTVSGPPIETAALLNGRARTLLSSLLGTSVINGVIRWRTTASYGRALEQNVQRVLELGKALSWVSDEMLKRLGENVVQDPNPFVRLYNLEVLVRHHRDAPETEEALGRALEDAVSRNAYFAARTLGGELGREYMKRFVLIGERDTDRIAAYEELLEHEGWETVLPLLESGALGTSRAVARRAMAWLEERGTDDDLLHVLGRATPKTPHADVVVQTVANKLGAAIEPHLLELLANPVFADAGPAHLAAVRALENFGSPIALATLREVAVASTGSALPVRKAARRAIAAIETRKSAQSGTLALVGAEEADGAVSIAAPTGALSEPEE